MWWLDKSSSGKSWSRPCGDERTCGGSVKSHTWPACQSSTAPRVAAVGHEKEEHCKAAAWGTHLPSCPSGTQAPHFLN
eukprot:185132-Chlamydomonas_euryale.AAC.1